MRAVRLICRLITLFPVGLGLFFLYQKFYVETSAYSLPNRALVLCGIFAPLLLLLEILVLEKWLSRGLMTVLAVTATVATTVLTFGEYIVFDLLKVDAVKYAADPGEMIQTVFAVLAAISVIFSYLVLQFRKKPSE